MESSNILFNPINYLYTDVVLRYSWLISVIGFVILFSFVLHQYRNINPNLRYIVTIASVFFFVMAAFTSITLFKGVSIQAGRDYNPTNLQIEQTGPQEVTIQWNTNKEILGYIIYKNVNIQEITALELPDTTGKLSPRTSHIVRIGGIKKATRYTFVIVQNGTTFDTYNGKQLEFTIQ
jgi:hypothetical protein